MCKHKFDLILENGAYCGIYDFELEHTKDHRGRNRGG